MHKHKKQWKDLTPKQRRAAVVAGIVQTIMMILVQRDLSRRSDAEVRGKKGLWRLAAFVQPFGPVAYLLFGRKARRSAA